MSDLLRESVVPVPPLSMASIEEFASEILLELDPGHLERPGELDLLNWVDHLLPQHGIDFCPVPDEQLGDCAAITDPDGTGVISVLIGSSHWDNLRRSGPRSYFARSTVAHEAAHAILHVPYLRRVRDAAAKTHQPALALRRQARQELKAFRDPEWQAFALGACILAPRQAITRLHLITPLTVSAVFGVSTAFAEMHLRRLKLLPPSPEPQM